MDVWTSNPEQQPRRRSREERVHSPLHNWVRLYLAGEDGLNLSETSWLALKAYLGRYIEDRAKVVARLGSEIEALDNREDLARWLKAAAMHEFDPF